MNDMMKDLTDMKLDRRGFIKVAAVVGASTMVKPVLADPVRQGLESSDLVYLSPFKSNGEWSSCQAEIWFVYDGADLFVCSDTDGWRVEAVKKGLAMTQFWVGDLGVWTRTDGQYRDLPAMTAKASIETDPAQHEKLLDMFADKYPVGWLRWGRSFRNGMKDGSRTMIRYQPVA
jgi:hypothetical protein